MNKFRSSFWCCFKPTRPDPQQPMDLRQSILNESDDSFSRMDLQKSIANETKNSFSQAQHLLSEHSNLVFSPLSIHVLLGMISAGSNGPTRDQIVGFVTSTSSSDDQLTAFFSQIVGPVLVDASPLGGPVLSTANGLWLDLDLDLSLNFKPAYRDLLHNAYKAASEHVDLQNKPNEVIEQVNKWGNKQTNGLIKDIVPSDAIDSSTKLFLANAAYFKGSWASSHKFNKYLTTEAKFYLLDGSSVSAPLMSSWEVQYFRAFDGFKVLRLPYEQGGDSRRFSMYIYLPDARHGLLDLKERLCSEPEFIDIYSAWKKEKLDKFLIPKFKISFDFEASQLVKGMGGLVLPFQDGVDPAIFPMEVSRMFHKSCFEMNEEAAAFSTFTGGQICQGTEAAAVSALAGRKKFACHETREKTLEFVADHPFLFVIREDTKQIVLFIGQLLNPLAAST